MAAQEGQREKDEYLEMLDLFARARDLVDQKIPSDNVEEGEVPDLLTLLHTLTHAKANQRAFHTLYDTKQKSKIRLVGANGQGLLRFSASDTRTAVVPQIESERELVLHHLPFRPLLSLPEIEFLKAEGSGQRVETLRVTQSPLDDAKDAHASISISISTPETIFVSPHYLVGHSGGNKGYYVLDMSKGVIAAQFGADWNYTAAKGKIQHVRDGAYLPSTKEMVLKLRGDFHKGFNGPREEDLTIVDLVKGSVKKFIPAPKGSYGSRVLVAMGQIFLHSHSQKDRELYMYHPVQCRWHEVSRTVKPGPVIVPSGRFLIHLAADASLHSLDLTQGTRPPWAWTPLGSVDDPSCAVELANLSHWISVDPEDDS